MRKLGIPENELSIQNAMCVALVQQALNGSIRAFKVIGEYMQQDPKYRRRERKSGRNYIYCRYSYEAKRKKGTRRKKRIIKFRYELWC